MDLTLTALIGLPLLGGLLAWPAARLREGLAYGLALAATAGQLALSLLLGILLEARAGTPWLAEVRLPWIPALGASFHLGLDGLSLILTSLTGAVGVLAVLASRSSIRTGTGPYLLCLLGALAALNGVFLSLDLLLFYLFWELLLIPLFLLILLWGHVQRARAALKFLLYTQTGGLLLLVGIVGLALETGATSLSLDDVLRAAAPSSGAGRWLMLAFFVAFAVKLPAFPAHAWLADAHAEAPVAGSLVLAGLVLKAGGYGLIRFLLPLFPKDVATFAPVAMSLGVAGILYGALMALGQRDLKRLIAYTSVSHMGYVLLGCFALNELALQGAVLVMAAHAASACALFLLAHMLETRLGTRNLGELGGLWAHVPRLGGVMLFFLLASLGLPGLAGFAGEFLVLLGVCRVSVPLAALAALGLVFSTAYSLRLMQAVFFGPAKRERASPPPDLTRPEGAACAALIVVTVWLGMHPQPFLDASRQAVRHALRLGEADATAPAHPPARLAPSAGQHRVARAAPP